MIAKVELAVAGHLVCNFLTKDLPFGEFTDLAVILCYKMFQDVGLPDLAGSGSLFFRLKLE